MQENMGLRGLVKMLECRLSRRQQETHDNLYHNKIEFITGGKDMPYKSSIYFTDKELNEFLLNIEKLSVCIKDYIDGRKKALGEGVDTGEGSIL